MKQESAPIYDYKSIAEIVLGSRLPRWKKWLLKKLMPESLWDLPAQELMKLQKGAVIGGITISLNKLDGITEIDLGVANDR